MERSRKDDCRGSAHSRSLALVTPKTSDVLQRLLEGKGADWGPCYFDQTHILTSYVTYQLPIGRGKQFGHDLNPVLNQVAEVPGGEIVTWTGWKPA